MHFIATAQLELYVVRNLNTPRFSSEHADSIYRKAVRSLDASNRVEVLGDANQSKVATHFLEVGVKITESAIWNAYFVDSTSTFTLGYGYYTRGVVDMLVTDVATGQLLSSGNFPSASNAENKVTFAYKDIGWSKGKKYEGQNKSSLDRFLKEKLKEELQKLQYSAITSMVRNFQCQPALKLFPFRLEVRSMEEVSKEKAKSVIISEGERADLDKRDRLVIYRVTEKKVGGKIFERAEVLGRIKYKQDTSNGGLCEVEKGEKRVFAAMTAGEKLYCSPGFVPYAPAKKSETAKLAVIVHHKDGTTEKQKQDYLVSLRFELMPLKQISLLEREKYSKIEQERNLQKDESQMDKAIIEQFKALGADLLLEVRMAGSVDMFNEKTTNTSFSLIEVETGKLIGSKNAITEDRVAGSGGILGALGATQISPVFDKSKQAKPSDLIKEMIPPLVVISEISDGDEKDADEVIIVGDIAFTRTKYFVFKKSIIDVEGESLNHFEQIGEILLKSEEGEGVINCNVQKGGKEIAAAMTDGELLYCSKNKTFFEGAGITSARLRRLLYGE